jgi:hypothetical protein
MLDIRGTTPLAYVKKENYEKFIKFLESVMDKLWPKRDGGSVEPPPAFTLKPPHSIPLRIPHNSLTLEQIQMVAKGDMELEEAIMFLAHNSDDDDSSYCSSDSSYGSDSEYDFDDKELAEVCMLTGNLGLREYCVR